MPDFEITAPDGRKFQVTAPEGATAEQALEKIKSQYQQKSSGLPSEFQLPATRSIQEFGEWARGPGQQPITGLKDLPGAASNIGSGLVKGAKAAAGAAYLGTGLLPAAEVALRSLWGRGTGALFGRKPEEGMAEASSAMGLLAPGRGMPRAAPAPPAAEPFGITAPRGEIPRGLQAPAQERVGEFRTQQEQQLGQAREGIARRLDPGGQLLARETVEAGDVVQRSLQREAAGQRAGVTEAYERARAAGGEVPAGVLENIHQNIRGQITLQSHEPVVIDDILTPRASIAIQHLEEQTANLRIQNRADPFGAPNPERITGVSPEGVDQVRKVLNSLRSDAYGTARATGDWADARATQAVLDAFDRAIAPHMPPEWLEARAQHSQYRANFRNPSDNTARVVEEIVGRNRQDPRTPNDVIDAIIGSGVNPTDRQVRVFRRVRGILGPDSVEMGAVRQGLFQRLVPEGATPARIRENLIRFLDRDGRDLAREAFTQDQQNLLRAYANIMPTLEVATTAQQPGFFSLAARRLMQRIGLATAAATSHVVAGLGPWTLGVLTSMAIGGAVERGAHTMSGLLQARRVARILPMIGEETARWQRAVQAATRSNNRREIMRLASGTAGLQKALQSIGINPQAVFAEQPPSQPPQQPAKTDKAAYGGPRE